MPKKRKLISLDWAMKRLLRSKANFEVLEGFLSELLKQDITILEVLDGESNKDTAQDKFNRLDIKVKNQQEEVILIEVQYEREFDYLQRILFATSKAVVEHMREGAPYQDVIKIISVNILYFDLGLGEDYVYRGFTSFVGIHQQDELQLSGKQKALFDGKHSPADLFPEYYLLKVNQFNDVARDGLDEWMYFLKNEEIKEEFNAKGLKKAQEVLDMLKLSEEERRDYDQYQEERHYQASMYQSSYVSGKLDGHKEGRAEGQTLATHTLAKKMLVEGYTAETIAHLTGLTIAELHSLKTS